MSGLFQPAVPDVAIEIDATRVAAARLSWRRDGVTLAAHAEEPLPAGAVVPSLASPNIVDVALVGRAVAQAVSRLGARVARAALVVPDPVAKVSLIRFEKVPGNMNDLAALVRWQVRKSAPFPVEQAIVSFTPGMTPPEGGREFVVSIARADIVEQYEQACSAAGVHAGLVDIATFSTVNSVLADGGAPSGDWLLVYGASTYTTVILLRGADVILYRNRDEEPEGTLADVVHQTAMYYEDRLKGAGFGRVLLAGTAVHAVDAVRRSLEQRLDVRIEPLAQAGLASLLGILARERRAA